MFEIFPFIFNSTFNILSNNSDIIFDMVDTIMNSEVMNNMVNTLESIIELNIECKEYDNGYIIEGNLPGINKKDITIDYDNNYITIVVKRNNIVFNGPNIKMSIVGPEEDIIKDYYVEDADPYKIKAVFKNEVLKVYVPKRQLFDDKSTIIDIEEYSSK